jgi:hypothetical protein
MRNEDPKCDTCDTKSGSFQAVFLHACATDFPKNPMRAYVCGSEMSQPVPGLACSIFMILRMHASLSASSLGHLPVQVATEPRANEALDRRSVHADPQGAIGWVQPILLGPTPTGHLQPPIADREPPKPWGRAESARLPSGSRVRFNIRTPLRKGGPARAGTRADAASAGGRYPGRFGRRTRLGHFP